MENNQEVKYDGFLTPSLILVGSDKGICNRGHIIDPYAKTKEQDGLLCGEWSRGFKDGLIHIYLIEPVSAIINKRQEWIMKKMLLKEPVSSITPGNIEGETPSIKTTIPKPKQKVVYDPVTKQFHLEM